MGQDAQTRACETRVSLGLVVELSANKAEMANVSSNLMSNQQCSRAEWVALEELEN